MDIHKFLVCFHDPQEENGFLSNKYLAPMTVNGKTYSSMEQYVMYQKAECFHDGAIAVTVMETNDPEEIKNLGRLVCGYDEHVWNGVRQLIVYDGLMAKFTQNEDLREKLIATGNKLLARCSETDPFWGIGMSLDDPDRIYKEKWKGQNQLGYALMYVREKIKEEDPK